MRRCTGLPSRLSYFSITGVELDAPDARLTGATLFVKTRHVCLRHNAQLNDIKPRDGRGQRHAFRLEVRPTDVFPAKEPGTDGPSSGSHHRQTHARG